MKVLVLELEQETSHFNPNVTTREGFTILPGEQLIRHFDDTNTYVAGSVDILRAEGIEVVDTDDGSRWRRT